MTCITMPLQKSTGVAILVSLPECGFFSAYNRAQGSQLKEANSRKPQFKIRLVFSKCNKNVNL